MAKNKWKIVTIDNQDFIAHKDLKHKVPLLITDKKILKYKDKLLKDFIMLLNHFDFPGNYIMGLSVVNITTIDGLDGHYIDGVISMSCNKTTLEMVYTFMHEAAHHVDNLLLLSADEDLVDEYDDTNMYRRFATSEAEYFAYGVEQFYHDKNSLKTTNPKLFKVINFIDKKIRKTDFDIFA